MLPYSCRWLPLIAYVCLWLLSVAYGFLCLSMGAYGCFWLPMFVYGCRWLLIVAYGFLCLSMVADGCPGAVMDVTAATITKGVNKSTQKARRLMLQADVEMPDDLIGSYLNSNSRLYSVLWVW